MRLLLSFVFTSFFFFAPHKGEAKKVIGKETATFAHSLSQTKAADYSEYGHQAIIIIGNSNVRHSSNQPRWMPGVASDHSGFFIPPVGVPHPASRLSEPYSYCTPIGLKLLFPKHYFW